MRRSEESVTRRELAIAFAAATRFLAQPLMGQATATPEDLDTAARDQMKRAQDQLRKFKVPIATEPSFAFRP